MQWNIYVLWKEIWKRNTDGAMAYGLGTTGSQWTDSVILVRHRRAGSVTIAIGGGIREKHIESAGVFSGINEQVVVGVVGEVLDEELVGTQYFGITVMVGILVKCDCTGGSFRLGINRMVSLRNQRS